MPDFGLTEALSKALQASKATTVMRPAEQALAARAAKIAPNVAVPDSGPQASLRTSAERAGANTTGTDGRGVQPSVQAPSATPAPGSVQAPPIDPSVPPPDVPPPAASDAASLPSAQPATPDVAPGAADAAPPTGALAASEPVPQAPETAAPKDKVPTGNTLPAAPTPEPAPSPTQVAARRFVSANIGDFPAEKLNMSHMPNLDTMSSPDGVKAAIAQVADDNASAIDASRRGIVTDEQLTGLAQDLAVNGDIVKQVLSREFGTAMQRPEVILAARMVEQNQVGTLISIGDRVAQGTASSADTAEFLQRMQQFVQYRTQLSGAVAEQGRGLRAMGLKVGMNLPPEVMDHIAQVIKQNNPDLQQVAAAIKLAGTPSGVSNILSGWASKSLWQKIPGAAFGMLQRIFINGILSGPQTWAKIFTGNNFNMAVNQFDLFSAGIGRGLYGYAARTGEFPTAAEGVQISDAMAHMHGVISGGADALRVAGRVLKTGQSLDGVMRSTENAGTYGSAKTADIFAQELGDSYFGSIVKGLDTVIDAPGRIIGATDEFAKTLGYRGYLTMMQMKELRARMVAGTVKPGDAESIMQDMMTNPSPSMQQGAEDWAHRMTFQSPFPEGGAGESFQNFLNKAPALRFIFPFMRTATNIFKQSMIERTPLAMFSARIRSQIAAGGFEGDMAKARIATGTAIGSMVAWMAIHDRLTGDAPKDAKERMAWQLDGRTPYSVRVTDPLSGKDTWRSYAWFEPLATTAGAISDIVKLQSYIHADDDVDTMMPHDDMTNQAIAHVMASIIQNTGNKTFMQGAAQFSEMWNDPQRAFSMWTDQMGANMQPYSGATKFVRNMQDPYMRQAFTLIDKIKDQLPTGAGIKGSQTLPLRLDVFGEPRTRSGDNSILGPLNPLPGKTAKPDPVTDEIQSLMEQTRTVPITMPSKQLALLGNGRGLQDGQGMRLTPQEYTDYVQMSRQDPIFDGGKTTFHDKLQQTMASPVYQQGTPAQRAVFVENVQNQADKIGRERLFKENPDFAERMTAWTAEKNRLKFNQ